MQSPNILILFQNGMVMAFDAIGNQMPEFQGSYNEVAPKLKETDLSQTQFQKGEWERSLKSISQAEFFAIDRQ